ncbi:MAG: oligosaccharide flippase family protein [Candidatus Sericytochromatia bacterium]
MLRNFGWKFLAETLSRGLGLLFLVLLARSLGDKAFGLYSLPLATAGLLAVVLDPGSHSVLIRELARAPEREAEVLGAVVWVRGLCSGLFLLLVLLSWPLFAGEVGLGRMLAAACILLGQSWIDTQIAWLNASEAFRSEARLRLWLKLALLLPQMLVLWLSPGIDALLLAGALAHLAWLPVLAVQFYRRLALPRFDLKGIKVMLPQMLGFWLANLSWLLYLKLDLVMLPLLGRPAAELGWYQAAVRFYELAGLPGYLLSMSAYPRLSALGDRPIERQAQQNRLLGLSLALGSATAVLGWAGAPLLPLLLGASFAPSVQALQLMSLSIPAVCLNQSLFAVLGAAGRQGGTARATAGCLIANGLLNLWLIPAWGYLGAAFSTLIADALLCALLFWQLKRMAATQPK